MTAKRVRGVSGLFSLVLLVFLASCSGPGAGESTSTLLDQDSSLHGSVRAVLAAGQDLSVLGVGSVRVDVLDTDGPVDSQVVEPVPFGDQEIADAFFVLRPGPYIVQATALDENDKDLRECAVAQTTVEVEAETTIEIQLSILCGGEGNGGLDVIVDFDGPPVITDLDFRPSKFTNACQMITILVTAFDLDNAGLEYSWQVIDAPAAARFSLIPTRQRATFEAVTAGTYQLKVTVTDSDGLTASLSFPVHVADTGLCQNFSAFDPTTDWPPQTPMGPTSFQPEPCLPTSQLVPVDNNTVVQTFRPIGPGQCYRNTRYCRYVNGQYIEVSQAAATEMGCEAFSTTVCNPLSDGNLPLACDSEPAQANNCETISICPEQGDVAANAQQTADPSFDTLPPLTPPGGATPNPNIGVDLTRAVLPCQWDEFQQYADSGIIDPVPVDKYNFYGKKDNGEFCSRDIECRSGDCDDDPDDIGDAYVCLDTTGTADPNPYRVRFDKGSNRWAVHVDGGLNLADARVQGLFYPSIGYQAQAGADFDLEVTAAGSRHEVLHVHAGIRLSNCSHERGLSLRIHGNDEDFDGFELGIGGAFVAVSGLGNDHAASSLADVQECRQAFRALRQEEETTNRALWDAFIATALHNVYGPAPGRTIANTAAAQSYINTYRNRVNSQYLPRLAAYQDIQPQATNHAFAASLAEVDLGYSWAAKRMEHHLGPVVLGAEIDVVGKLGVEVSVKSKTDWTAPDNAPVIEPEVAAGVEAIPHTSIWGYISIYGGVDILLASVTAGIQGELEFAGLAFPMVADFGVDRALVNVDTAAVSGCLSLPFHPGCIAVPAGLQPMVQPTGAQWRIPWGYNLGLEGTALDGRIVGFVKAKFLLFSRTWKKTFAEWEGVRNTIFELGPLTCPNGAAVGQACGGVTAVGCCLGGNAGALKCNEDSGQLVADPVGVTCGGGIFDVASQGINVGPFLPPTLPAFGSNINIGEQRDMVYLPTMQGILQAPNSDLPLDDFGMALNGGLAANNHWDRDSGGFFCSVFVP